ncbi:MAG: hypothetical protein NTU48_10305 [Legionellales bacterium]|nr:hypothetical protein [Legionellales bacterium]
MKKLLGILISGWLLACTGANAHTSITFAVSHNMMRARDYDDMIFMEEIQAERMHNRLMRMRLARMRYHHPMRVIRPIYPQPYYYAYEEPYFMRTQAFYSHHRIASRHR